LFPNTCQISKPTASLKPILFPATHISCLRSLNPNRTRATLSVYHCHKPELLFPLSHKSYVKINYLCTPWSPVGNWRYSSIHSYNRHYFGVVSFTLNHPI
jgi:hypothetical protein